MDQLGVKVDEVISNFLEQTEALRTENAQKSAKVDQLTKVVSDLESDLAKLTLQSLEQQRDLNWLRLKFESIRAEQTAVIELLETKLSFCRRVNDKLCELLSKTSAIQQENNDRLLEQVERLKEELAAKDCYKKNMEKLLSDKLEHFDPEIPKLLERYASDVRDAHREKNSFETALKKFKSGDRESRDRFLRLCQDLIEKQKQFIESQSSSP